ncbi:protein jagged-1 [Lasius niger]|uniref:Protein jagged-1 n=1 Tax=Lasius niger TaxID=67767 RepID=A0A0J7K1W0_LASNI|nr:protein jagged-1 [Lasius niger]
MVPSMELLPPMFNTTAGLSQEMQDLADKPSIEDTSNEDTKHEQKPPEEEQTAEPLGPIVITDPPTTTINVTDTTIITTTIDPAATAGKWPTEATTEPSERDDENETK